MNRLAMRLALLAAPLLVVAPAQAALTIFQGNLAGFNAAAGNPPVTINFDTLSGNIVGNTIGGVTFSSPDGNTLEVVAGASTFTPAGFGGVIDANTNRLFPTSGANVLSPGGLSLVAGPGSAQLDSLQLVFATPQSAFGLDILFQSFDIQSFVSYQVFGAGNTVLASGNVSGTLAGGGAPGGALFFGLVSNDAGTNFSRIVFTDSDGDANNPDANIGFDTLRFGSSAGAVPEPATWAMMIGGFGLVGGAMRRTRHAKAILVA